MNRYSYLNELNLLLLDLPEKEREDTLNYFDNYFKNHPDMTEDEMMQVIGSPAENAKRIREKFIADGGNLPDADVFRQTEKKTSYSWLWIILSILTFPIWIPIGAALLAVCITMMILLSIMMLVVGIMTIIIFVGGISVLISGIMKLFVVPIVGITMVGAGMMMLGISILFINLYVVIFGKGIPALVRKISALFKGRRKKKEGRDL